MKTYNKLINQIKSFENLLTAANKAAKGQRSQPNVLLFFWKLEENLFQLQKELETQCYSPAGYSTFFIYEPKPRMISAAPFRDRVVHHALMNVISPLLERSFIVDTYANRVGKGTHKAICRYQSFLQEYEFVLKCDIKSYFPSIDHEILKSLLRKRIACKPTLWLLDTIIDGSNPQQPVMAYFPGDRLFTPVERRIGLPIGNLTSQWFGNYYLNPLDHFVKEKLQCKAYVRYVDDFVLFSNKKTQLWQWKKQVELFLQKFRLKLHPARCQVYPAAVGYRFLGQVVFRTHRRLAANNVRKFKKRKRKWERNPPVNLRQRLDSWIGHASQANTYSLLNALGLI
ncbi:MAG: RNA-directed DNA polymerase [Candidatus Aminicenantes bacterium]|nr:MAG: RNA-directed DNA polymerase [Candidatus Aminicenantes bacterium]